MFCCGIIAKMFCRIFREAKKKRGKKTSREKRRISDSEGGYGKHLNEIPLALGCTAWQSDTPPTSNRVIRHLSGSSRLATFCDRSLVPLGDLLITARVKKEQEEEEKEGKHICDNGEDSNKRIFFSFRYVIQHIIIINNYRYFFLLPRIIITGIIIIG
jgi:hypothetical protein